MTRVLPPLTPGQTQALIVDTEPWMSCEECFEVMDRYVDALLSHAPHPEPPGLLTHLAACTACAEEVSSLLDFTDRQAGSA